MMERSKCMNVPEIRFKEFCDYYSDVLLEKCLSVSNKKNNKLEYKKEDALSVSDEFGVVNQIEHLGRSYTGNNISTYKILNKGQIVYTKSPLKLKPFGIIKVNNNKPGIVSVLYAIYDVKEGFDPNYISVYFEPSFRLNKYLLPLINKGAKNTINISDETALSGEVHIPLSHAEQQKIVSYFQSLDSLIQIISKKLASLKRIKAASLQSMFPQEGETVPKVRFNGFEEEWSLKCVSELLCERNELSPQSPEFPLMAFIANNGITEKGERYDRSALVNDVINKQYKRTYYGDFIYSSNNLETGSIGLNTYGKATISPVYSIFYCTLNSDSNFVGYCMTRKSFIKEMIKWRQGVMYGQWRIHEKDFLRIKVLVPSLPEQQKIGAYFRSLDRQISLQTQRLEKLKQIKAACLDKMFV